MTPSSIAALVQAARVACLFGLILLGGALPVAAQVPLTPPPGRPAPPKIMPLPKDLVGDLVITSVTVRDEVPAAVTTAQVSIQNKGAAPVTFPAGSVLARGDAAQAGGIALPPMTTPVAYTIPAGESRTLSLVADVCATARTGTVTFWVDPDNKVSEANEGNNTLAVGFVSSFAAGDLQLMGISFVSTDQRAGDQREGGPLSAGYPATMRLTFRNAGMGYLLVCPGVAI